MRASVGLGLGLGLGLGCALLAKACNLDLGKEPWVPDSQPAAKATLATRAPCAHHDQRDPHRAAVYYARIVENPSCRWSTWKCLSLPASERPDACTDPRVPRTVQERAWTSPIWFTP